MPRHEPSRAEAARWLSGLSDSQLKIVVGGRDPEGGTVPNWIVSMASEETRRRHGALGEYTHTGGHYLAGEVETPEEGHARVVRNRIVLAMGVTTVATIGGIGYVAYRIFAKPRRNPRRRRRS